jgi:hypothetical protein
MISDQQRRLLGEALPTGRLKPEVISAEDIPDRLLREQQLLVGAVQGVFGSSSDPLADQALDPANGLALACPGRSRPSRLRGRRTVFILLCRVLIGVGSHRPAA